MQKPFSTKTAWTIHHIEIQQSNQMKPSCFSRFSMFRHYGRKKKIDMDFPYEGSGANDAESKPKRKPKKKAAPESLGEGDASANLDLTKPLASPGRNLTSKGLDFGLDDEVNDALRNIESGDFDLDEFLLNEGGEDMLLEDDMIGVSSRGKIKKDKKAEIDLSSTKFKSDIDEFDEINDELDESLAGIIDEDDDMMLDMVAGEENFDLFDGEDELDAATTKAPVFSGVKNTTASSATSKLSRKRVEANITFPDDDEVNEFDDPSKPLVIDGIQLDRKV
jgi:hypothetical protein